MGKAKPPALSPKDARRERPIKVSDWFHVLAKQVATNTGRDIGEVVEDIAGALLVAENKRLQAELQSLIPNQRA